MLRKYDWSNPPRSEIESSEQNEKKLKRKTAYQVAGVSAIPFLVAGVAVLGQEAGKRSDSYGAIFFGIALMLILIIGGIMMLLGDED